MPFIFCITLIHITQALLETVTKTKGTLGISTEIQLIVSLPLILLEHI